MVTKMNVVYSHTEMNSNKYLCLYVVVIKIFRFK
jgi:hypothetical protein